MRVPQLGHAVASGSQTHLRVRINNWPGCTPPKDLSPRIELGSQVDIPTNTPCVQHLLSVFLLLQDYGRYIQLAYQLTYQLIYQLTY